MSVPTDLKIVLTTKKGRGLQVTKRCETGRLIMKQQPYAYVIMEEHVESVCHYCLTMPGQPDRPEVHQLLKCGSCKFARYCDKECQKKAWTNHKPECAAIKRLSPRKADDQTRLVARILWSKETNPSKDDPVNIEDLEDHLNKRTGDEKEKLEEKVFNFGDYFTYDAMPDSDDVMLHLFASIDCNAIGLNDHKGLQTIAVGIYPLASLLNHDCDPNCVAINNGSNIEVRSLRSIESEEEICISYIDCLETTEQRQQKLMTQYYFDCGCDLCRFGGEREDLKHAINSPDVKKESIDYIERFSNDMLKRLLSTKKKQNWERLSNQVMGTLAQQDCVITDTNVLKLAVLNYAVEVQSYLRRLDSALEFAERVAAAYQKLLPSVHPMLGMYLMRVGILEWQLQKNQQAAETLGRAASIISKTFGEDHSLFKQLLGLLQQCRVEAHMSRNSQRQFRLAKKAAGLGLPQAF